MAYSEHIDVLIICALKDEFDQLLSVNEGIETKWKQSSHPSGRIVADAVFKTFEGSPPLTVRITWNTFMGREEASAVAHQMLRNTKYNCIAMTGICAGRRGKVELGDVIFADRLWSYDAGKVTIENGKEVFEGDMIQYRPKSVLVQRMQNLTLDINSWPLPRPDLTLEYQEDWVIFNLHNQVVLQEHPEFNQRCPNWSDVIPRLVAKGLIDKVVTLTTKGTAYAQELSLKNPGGIPQPKAFAMHVAPIATGAAVVEDSSLFHKLSGSMRKVLGIDMEASALGTIAEVEGIPIIVAKAVSDFGDEFKDDRYRHFASQASARAMLHFLRVNADIITDKQLHYKPAAFSQNDLLDLLAEEYPEISHARALWKRAGGKNSELANNSRPKDMWLEIWSRSLNGASVTPYSLLKEVQNDYPENPTVEAALTSFSENNYL